MASSNGGTLHGVPPIQPGGFTCGQCGLIFDSGASLQVHMHYQHENQQNRWSNNSSTPSSTNSGNNSPPSAPPNCDQETNSNGHLKHTPLKCSSPPNSMNTITSSGGGGGSTNTIAAADSSDNQPATPSSLESSQRYGGQDLNYYHPHHQTSCEQQQQQQHYQSHYPTAGTDYPANSSSSNNNLMMQPPHEYKSSRYHPYSTTSVNSQSGGNGPAMTSPTTNNASPRIVSSTSPGGHQHLGQPTPSPSPKQCDKCGLVCATASELNDHYVTVHAGGELHHQQLTRSHSETATGTNSEFSGSAASSNFSSPYATIVKDEPACDILDLDSQKMVYPPHHANNNNDPSLMNNNNGEGPLPPMQSMHTLQRQQHSHPILWHHAPTGHDAYMQQQRGSSEYGMMSPIMKSEYGSAVAPPSSSLQSHLSSSPSSGGVPSIKSEYMGMAGEMKSFDQSSITTSPSDFPTTTTPQDSNNNNTGSQFRNFEPPTSSLPAGLGSTKSGAWKSNEARRPKTYNCTACNKWFTSSGHLKRHYNTTLHKNAVKASNQPDPATMPISVHHHPARDPNSKHHRNNAQSANHPPPQPQPPPPTSDPQRSPDYAPQFAAVGGYTSSSNSVAAPVTTLNQGFQHYNSGLHSTTVGIPPNGQAGPSVHASLPRGLLTYSTNNNHMEVQQPLPPAALQRHTISSEATTTTTSSSSSTSRIQEQLEREQPSHTHITTLSSVTTTTPPPQLIISTSMEQQLQGYISNRLGITTTSPLSRLEAIHPPLSYPIIIGSEPDTDTISYPMVMPISSSPFQEYAVSSPSETYTIRLLTNAHVGDTAPYSPSMPNEREFKQQHLEKLSQSATVSYEKTRVAFVQQQRSQEQMIPKLAATAPQLSPSPCSPSVTSSDSVMVMVEQESKKYQCVQCDKTFNKSCYLTQHNKTFHSGEKPFKCHRCGKRFSCGQSHEDHVAKHVGDKPFKCELCPKAFNHKTDLRRHMCLHSGSKPFHCEACGKGFIRKDHLVKHMDVHKRKAEQMKRKLEQHPVETGAGKGEKAAMYKKIKLEPGDEEDNSLMMSSTTMIM